MDKTGSERAADAARSNIRASQVDVHTPGQTEELKPLAPDVSMDFSIYDIGAFRNALMGGDAEFYAKQFIDEGVTVAEFPDFFDDLSGDYVGETAIYYGETYGGDRGFGAQVDTYQDENKRIIILEPGESPPMMTYIDEDGNSYSEPAIIRRQFMLADGAIQQAAQTIKDGIAFAQGLLATRDQESRAALIDAQLSWLDQREAMINREQDQEFAREQQGIDIDAAAERDAFNAQAAIDLEALRSENQRQEQEAAQEGRDLADEAQREWEEEQREIDRTIDKERQDFLDALDKTRYFADRGVAEGDFDAVAESVQEAKRLEKAIFGFDIMKTIVANPQMLSIMTAGGFWDQLEAMSGLNLGGLKSLSETQANQTLGGVHLPSLKALTSLDAAQQQAMLFNMSAKHGIASDLIVQEIHRRANLLGKGLVTGAGGQGAQGLLRLPAGT